VEDLMRTTVNIDDASLKAAQDALGTVGLTETVNRALLEVARQARLRTFDVRDFDITDGDIAEARADRLE
jgi:Arc/MetJ family transcription regulator